MTDTLSLLEALSNADAVPGWEEEVLSLFELHWQSLEPLRRDRLGSVIAETPAPTPDAPRVAIECHLDEVGFMVRSVTREGLLKIIPLGGFWSQALPGQRVRLLTAQGKVNGVFGAIPPHLLGRHDRDRAVDVNDLLVDIGAASPAEVEAWGVRPGTLAVPASTFGPLGQAHRLVGKAFDNRVGCALCIQTLLRAAQARGGGDPVPCTVVGVGSVQEEVGLRGVRTAAAVAQPDLALVVEGAPADDLTTSPEEAQGKLGGGVQIRAYDPTMIAAPRLVDFALEVARAEGIPHQLAVRTTGGTDAGQLHLVGQGVPCLVLSVPVRYAHSHVGVIDRRDLEATEKLVWALVLRLDAPDLSKASRALGVVTTTPGVIC